MARRITCSLVLALLFGAIASASHNPCNRDPGCNQGVGGIAGYVCVRSEVNPLTDEFNGRVCSGGTFRTSTYLYVRGLSNRDPLVLCRDFQQVYPERDPTKPDFCEPAH